MWQNGKPSTQLRYYYGRKKGIIDLARQNAVINLVNQNNVEVCLPYRVGGLFNGIWHDTSEEMSNFITADQPTIKTTVVHDRKTNETKLIITGQMKNIEQKHIGDFQFIFILDKNLKLRMESAKLKLLIQHLQVRWGWVCGG